MASYRGITIALYGDTGAGKTAQIGEYAKYVWKTRHKKLLLITSDMGGWDTIAHLVRAGLVIVVELLPTDDPWIYVDKAINGSLLTDEIGAIAFDSATSMSEALLTACHKSTTQIGQQRTQRFTVTQGKESLNVSINNEAHYGVVQGFMLDAIWRSTWLTRQGVDILWTFSVHRGEEQDRTPILGPKLAGKALTAAIPKWFKYTLRIVSIPQDNDVPIHRLYLTEHSELAGLGHSFGNSRVPLDATPLPVYIEPASISEFMTLIETAQKEADDKLALEFSFE